MSEMIVAIIHQKKKEKKWELQSYIYTLLALIQLTHVSQFIG